MRRNVYNSAVFAGVDLFAVKFYLDRVVPINHSWRQKTRDTGLPDGEDHILLRSLVLTQYRSVRDRKTDGRICSNIGYTALCKNVAAASLSVIVICSSYPVYV